MKTPTIEEILTEWKADAIIDESNIVREIIKIPSLHSKYLGYFIFFKNNLATAESNKNKMAWQKRKYFRGEFDRDDLQKFGWSQWNGLKPSSASELSQLLEFDKDMVLLTQLVSELKTSVSGCEYVLASLKGREYSLRAVVDYQKFVAGS